MAHSRARKRAKLRPFKSDRLIVPGFFEAMAAGGDDILMINFKRRCRVNGDYRALGRIKLMSRA